MFGAWKKRSSVRTIAGQVPVGTPVCARMRRVLLRRVGIGAVILTAVMIVVQFAYPCDRSLPFASVNGVTVGNKTTAELALILQDAFDGTIVTLKAENTTSKTKLSALGATFDVEKTMAQVTNYAWWQRLLPFSSLVLHPKTERLYVMFDDTQVTESVTALAARMTSQPKNGAVSLSANGEVVVAAAENGVTVSAENALKAVKTAQYGFGSVVVAVTPNITKPSVTNEMIESVRAKITAVLEKQVTFSNALDRNATYTPDKATVASWIHIGDDLSLSLDKAKVAAYANKAAKSHLVTAGTTRVTIVDGIETGRTVGASGRGVNLDTLVSDLTKTLLNGTGPAKVTIGFVVIPPSVTYSRSYTNSQEALQAYINEVTAGGNIEISVRQLTGAGWSASSGAAKSVVSASTYKLFISLLLFDKINAGQIHWSDIVSNVGKSVETCLYDTIHISANYCTEEWINEWGRANINAALYAKGFSSATTFMAADASRTSAGDLLKLLVGLQNRTLFNSSDADRLIGLMKQQVFRSGIPAGSGGVVADKVGFLWDYLNDAAIVYHPRGTYVLVIMTKGQSWAKIAEITRQIEKIMYP